MKILDVRYSMQSTVVSGRLAEGRYFGPEAVEAELTGGAVFRSCICGMSATTPQGWPILPEHDTILELELAGSPLPSRISEGATLRGVGFANGSQQGRRCINELLELPVFWALEYYLLIHDDVHDESELAPQLTGIGSEEINDFFRDHFTSDHGPQPWPFVQIRLTDGSYVEVEYAEDVEYQTRYKIADKDGPITVGYQSGHFSLPSLRWEELEQLARNTANPHEAAQCLLLLYPGIYINADQRPAAVRGLEEACTRLEFFPAHNRSRIFQNVTSNTIRDGHWRRDDRFGWTCDGKYSQRNPSSKLSTIRDREFQRIAAFFEPLH